MCYVGKATKIFIFLITVLIITSLVFVFGILRRTVHAKSHQCSGDSCYQSDFYPPPSPPFPEFSIPSAPDLTFNPPPPPSLSPSRPPSSPGSSTSLSMPPPAAASAPPPPPESSVDRTPSPPPPPVPVVTTPLPPSGVVVAPPPPVVVVAPPPVVNSPSQVPVTPGPVNSS